VDISQRLPRGLAGGWLLNGRANFRDDALVRAKLDVAAYRLVPAVSGGGQEQSPGRFTRRKTCSCRLTAEIERNQDALAPELAREKEEIPVGTHAPIATKRKGCPLAPQLVAELGQLAELLHFMLGVQGVDLPPGGHAQLAPGGLHVMLVGLHDPLVVGKGFPLTLNFEKAGSVTVEVEVEKKPSHGAGPAMGMEHDHGQPTQ